MAAHSASYAGLTGVSIHFHKERYAKMLDCRAGKFSRLHPIPLNTFAQSSARRRRVGPWGEVNGRIILAQQVSDVFCKADAPAALGAPGYTIHGLRYTVASRMDEMGNNHRAMPQSSGKSGTRSCIAPSAKVQRAREPRPTSQWNRFAQILCSEGDGFWKGADVCAAITKEFF